MLQNDFPNSVQSFVEMTRYLLRLEGENTFILSEHINQDPLENYFRQQRGIGGRCTNPSVDQAPIEDGIVNSIAGIGDGRNVDVSDIT